MKKKRVIIGTVIAAAVVAAAFFVVLREKKGGASDAVYVQQVSGLNYVSTGGYTNRYTGVVETQQTQKVAFESGRTLEKLYVEEGDSVKSGDKLFAYDTASKSLEIQQKDLEIEQLNSNISSSKEQIAELQKDQKSAKGSDAASIAAQIQTLQVDISQAEYDIKTAEAEKKQLQKELDNSVVRATIDGNVESIADLVDAGEGGSMVSDPSESGSTTYITILATGSYRIKGKVSEQNVYDLTEEMPVLVRSRVDESMVWSGTVSSVETRPEESSEESMVEESESVEKATNYTFYVDLEDTDGLMLGQHVVIEPDSMTGAKDGIWLDEGYFVIDEEGNASVWMTSEENGRLKKSTVVLGEYDEVLCAYQVTEGLSNTDYIAWPDESLTEGSRTTTEILSEEGEEDGMTEEEFTEGDEYMDEGSSEDEYFDEEMLSD